MSSKIVNRPVVKVLVKVTKKRDISFELKEPQRGALEADDKSLVIQASPYQLVHSFEDLPYNATRWPLIVMTTKGRFANGLFQYALALIVRELFPEAMVGVSERVDSFARQILDPESLVLPIISKKFYEENSFLYEQKEPDYRRGDMNSFFLPSIQNAVEAFKKSNTITALEMEAFDYKILATHQHLLLRKMKINKRSLEKADEYIREVLVGRFGRITPVAREEVVCIHIRRKDFLLFSLLFHKHGLPGVKYYKSALYFYRSKLFHPTFIVCTDDEHHANITLPKLSQDSDIIIKEKGSKEEDMAILASCKYFILTIGTFGFIPAFLADGEVVYPIFTSKTHSHFENDTSIPTWKVFNFEEQFDNFHGILA